MTKRNSVLLSLFILFFTIGLPRVAHAEKELINLNTEENTGQSWIAEAGQAERNQEFQRALDLYERAAILPGSEEAATVGAARVEVAMGDPEKAFARLTHFVTQMNPFSLDAHLALVDVHLALDQEPQAEAELKIVGKLRANYGPADERIGAIAYRKGNYKLALTALISALEQNPQDTEALRLRAKVYMKLEKYPLAVADYKALEAMSPSEKQQP